MSAYNCYVVYVTLTMLEGRLLRGNLHKVGADGSLGIQMTSVRWRWVSSHVGIYSGYFGKIAEQSILAEIPCQFSRLTRTSLDGLYEADADGNLVI